MGVVEEQVEQDADDRHHDHDGEAVGADGDVADDVDGLVADQLGAVALGACPDLEGQTHEEQEHAEGRHQLLGGPRTPPLERTEDDPLEEEPDAGADDQQGHRRGDGQADVPLRVHLPQDVGHEHGDGAVGEVEDAGGLVGQHEADAGQRVDAAGADAGEDQREPELHRLAPTCLRPGLMRSVVRRGGKA